MLTIDLQGRVALVIGGSRGIGGAVTETLAQAGANVVFTHTGNPEHSDAIDALLSRVQALPGDANAAVLDACDAPGTRTLVDQTVEQCGKIDILVHNVGRNLPRRVEEVSDEEWRQFLDLNLTTAFNSVRAVVPHMVQAHYGKIILIGSSAVYSGGGGAIDYAAAKSGLVGIMTYLCKEYGYQGIVTNIIHPCVIDTGLLRRRYASEDKRQKLLAQMPVGRFGRPEEVAALAAYLASAWGDYICGQAILMDGGRTLFRQMYTPED